MRASGCGEAWRKPWDAGGMEGLGAATVAQGRRLRVAERAGERSARAARFPAAVRRSQLGEADPRLERTVVRLSREASEARDRRLSDTPNLAPIVAAARAITRSLLGSALRLRGSGKEPLAGTE